MGGGAEAGAGGAWQTEVDDRVARSPGCPFGGDAGAEEEDDGPTALGLQLGCVTAKRPQSCFATELQKATAPL